MVSYLLYTPLKGQPPLLDKLVVESAESVLFRDRGDNNTWVVRGKCFVDPQEVRISTEDGEGRSAEQGGSCLGGFSISQSSQRKEVLTLVWTVYIVYAPIGLPTFCGSSTVIENTGCRPVFLSSGGFLRACAWVSLRESGGKDTARCMLPLSPFLLPLEGAIGRQVGYPPRRHPVNSVP